jgi:sugar/nucleoside kinase (ribokinase family)
MIHRIAIIGNLNIDLILRGIDQMPAWGQEVMGTGHTAASAGQAGTLAMALARFGIPVSVISAVGTDPFGDQILHDLGNAGVDLTAIERAPGTRTAIAVAVVRPDGERSFISDFTPLERFDRQLVSRHEIALSDADLVCLVGIFCLPKYSLSDMAATLQAHKAAGRVTMLDTGWDPGNWRAETLAGVREILSATDLFLPNLDEARAITGLNDPVDAARALAALGPRTVIVKCGHEGAIGLRGEEVIHCPARETEVVDAVGAGDSFNAGYLYAHAAGWPLLPSLAIANATAAYYIARQDDRFPSVEQVSSVLANYPTTSVPEVTSH